MCRFVKQKHTDCQTNQNPANHNADVNFLWLCPKQVAKPISKDRQ
jgi:hypothetical protein